MFCRTRSFARLASSQAVRLLAPPARLFGLITFVAIAIASLAPAAKAETITEFTGGALGASSGQYFGQSVTTAGGGPWTNIIFNFYAQGTGNPYATGNLYLLNTAYTGTPAGLSSSTSGYIANAAASGGTWTFDPSVTLQPGTQYWFYMDSATTANTLISNTNGYAGGNEYSSGFSDTVPFASVANFDANFTLQGEAAPGPIPGAGLLSYLLVGFGGLAAFRKKLRARAVSLFAMLKLRWPAIALLNPGALKRARA